MCVHMTVSFTFPECLGTYLKPSTQSSSNSRIGIEKVVSLSRSLNSTSRYEHLTNGIRGTKLCRDGKISSSLPRPLRCDTVRLNRKLKSSVLMVGTLAPREDQWEVECEITPAP